MITCGVYRDLILLYVTGECGNDTKELVKKHIAQCKNCHAYYKELSDPIQELEEEQKNSEEIEIVKKVSRGLKKKWIYSLAASVAAITLSAGLVFLTVNQLRGEGICYTSLDERYYVKAYLRAIQKGDYEKAFRLMDIEQMYMEITDREMEQIVEEISQDYQKVWIGEKEWYLNQEAWEGEYQSYLKDKSEANFWASMMIYNYNSSQWDPVAIPEEPYEEAAQVMQQKTGMTPQIYSQSKDIDNNQNISYVRSILPTGEGFYILKDRSFDTVTFHEPCIPSALFEEQLQLLRQQQELMTACADYYEKMGFDTYQELVHDEFMEQMQLMEAYGLEIQKITIRDSYRILEEKGQECWQVEVAVHTGREGGGRLVIMAQGNALRVGGGVDIQGELAKLEKYIHISADPAGFYK